MTPLQIAQQRCAHMPLEDRQLFELLFERGREDAETGADDEARARALLTAGQEAALAGYLEGLASTRRLRPLSRWLPGTGRLCDRGSYAGYEEHTRAGEPADEACRAANARRSQAIRDGRVMAA